MSLFGRPSLGGRNVQAKAAPGAGKEVYCFPILQPQEIIEVLRDMGVVVTEDDVNKPKSEQFRQICEVFIIDVLGMTKEEMYAPVEDFAPRLGEHCDLHDESVPVVHFLRNINKVLQAARCDEGFTLRDLMRPDRTRVLRILSALINLQKFRADKLVWYEELEARKTELVAKKAAVLARQDEVRARIAQEQEARAAEQPAIDAVTAQRRELQEQLQRLRARDEAARAATSAQRQDILAVREAKKELLLQLEAAREETEARRAQVVASPARLKAEIVTLEALVEQEQRAVDELDGQKRVLSRQLEVVAKAEKDVNKALLLMGEAEAEAKKLKLVIKDEKQRKVEAEAVGTEVEALRAQAENALAHRRRAEEKLREAREGVAQRGAALARAIDVTRHEAAEFGEELKAAVDARRAAEAEKMRLERQQSALTARHSQEVAEMIGTMKHFAGSVASFDAGLLGQLAGVEAVEVAPGRS